MIIIDPSIASLLIAGNVYFVPLKLNQPTSLAHRVTLLPKMALKTKTVVPSEVPEFPSEEIFENVECEKLPTGFGIPGFSPGMNQSQVLNMFGAPSQTLPGYWPNTVALIYDLIPNEISLGFLFDKDSQLLRQTEASFLDSVKSERVLKTLESMLGCRLNPYIEWGFFRVWLGEAKRYNFIIDSLEGVIERDKGGRVYIGVWQEDLH